MTAHKLDELVQAVRAAAGNAQRAMAARDALLRRRLSAPARPHADLGPLPEDLVAAASVASAGSAWRFR